MISHLLTTQITNYNPPPPQLSRRTVNLGFSNHHLEDPTTPFTNHWCRILAPDSGRHTLRQVEGGVAPLRVRADLRRLHRRHSGTPTCLDRPPFPSGLFGESRLRDLVGWSGRSGPTVDGPVLVHPGGVDCRGPTYPSITTTTLRPPLTLTTPVSSSVSVSVSLYHSLRVLSHGPSVSLSLCFTRSLYRSRKYLPLSTFLSLCLFLCLSESFSLRKPSPRIHQPEPRVSSDRLPRPGPVVGGW